MTMAAATGNRTAEAQARLMPSRIARVDLLGDLDAAEAAWRNLETAEQLFTPYQRFDFLSSWQREVGARDLARPLIVVGYDAAHRPLVLLPLTARSAHGVRVACFMGGKHATFNMALWDREFAAGARLADLNLLIGELRRHSAADVLALTQQPARWHDAINPFAMLPHQVSTNDCPVLNITPGAAATSLISNSFRKRLKTKERKLQKLPGYHYLVATDDADITRLLDWFFQVKPLRMAQKLLPNVFTEPGVEAFIRKACLMPRAGGGRAIDIHALQCDEETIALFAGVADEHRFSVMFNTYTLSERAHFSPGLILMQNIVDHYATRGYRALDLGIGADDYKRLFCKSDEPLFDSFVPLSARGRLAATAMSAMTRGKHLVKHNQALLGLAQRLRKAVR
ncbi:MAG: GNAT family N-acetyltransferase [Bradyrhizobium sp.]